MAIKATLSSDASMVRSEANVEAVPSEARSALRATSDAEDSASWRASARRASLAR